MQHLPRFLLVVLLFLAQAWAGAHAIEHAAGREGTLPPHVCEFCLAAHDLGSALPSLVTPVSLPTAQVLVDVLPSPDRSALPPPAARQRGPPVA